MEPLTEPQVPSAAPSVGERPEKREPVRARTKKPLDKQVLVTLFRREVALASEGFRFRLVTLLILVLMIASALLSSVYYQAEVKIYHTALEQYDAALAEEKVAGLVTLEHPAIKPPWKLVFLVEGGQTREPNAYWQALSPWTEPRIERLQAENPRLYAVEPLDWLFVIRVVLSLAAFILGYDAFCGQRQQTMLKMNLTYPVARWHLASVKILAIWVCLAAPFLVGALMSLGILHFYHGHPFGFQDWVKISAISILGLWASFIFVLVALLVSVASRAAARSFAILAFIWLAAVVVIPAAGGLVVALVSPLPSDTETSQGMTKVRQTIENKGAGRWRPLDIARADDFAEERASARKQHRRFNGQEEIRRSVSRRRFDRLGWTRNLGSILPMVLIQDIAERLVDSGPYRSQRFLEQAWSFREDLKVHVRQLDEEDAKSPSVHFVEDFMSEEGFDVQAMPRFEYRAPGLYELLARSLGRGLCLFAMMATLAIALFLVFSRKDLQ